MAQNEPQAGQPSLSCGRSAPHGAAEHLRRLSHPGHGVRQLHHPQRGIAACQRPGGRYLVLLVTTIVLFAVAMGCGTQPKLLSNDLRHHCRLYGTHAVIPGLVTRLRYWVRPSRRGERLWRTGLERGLWCESSWTHPWQPCTRPEQDSGEAPFSEDQMAQQDLHRRGDHALRRSGSASLGPARSLRRSAGD